MPEFDEVGRGPGWSGEEGVGRKAGERSDSFHARKTKSFGMVAARRVRLKL